MQKTLRWLERLKQVRLSANRLRLFFSANCLLDVNLPEQSDRENMERGLSLAHDTGINFWRAGMEAHLAVEGGGDWEAGTASLRSRRC